MNTLRLFAFGMLFVGLALIVAGHVVAGIAVLVVCGYIVMKEVE